MSPVAARRAHGARVRPVRSRRVAAGALAAVSLLAAAGVASGTPRVVAPRPGSAAQIAAAVASAPRITSLPAPSFPTLGAEGSDSATREFPPTAYGCLTPTACVFGDTASPRTIFLYGDSHAQMWLSAVVPAARDLGDRVVLMYLGGCPFADLTVWNPIPLPPFPAGYYHACNWFRARAIHDIDRMHPSLVLLSNRTAMVPAGPGTWFTRRQWQHGVRATINAIRPHVGTIAVIGDIVYMSKALPECLAAYPRSVQACASPNPNLAAHSHEAAERDAARAAGAKFIDTLPWTCSASCSPVIGPFLVYLNSAHLDATYVSYLSGVMLTALERVLR